MERETRQTPDPAARASCASRDFSSQIKVPWNPEILIHDLRTPLPFRDGSASTVYSSHLLEHLYFEEGQRLIRETHRVLAEGAF